MTRMIAVEWYKIRRRRLNWVTLAVLCTVMVAIYLLLWAATSAVEEVLAADDRPALLELRSALFLEETVPFAVAMLHGFGIMAGIVVVGANVGSEYTWNTVRTLSAAYPQRSLWLLAKVTALAAAIVVGLLVALAASILTSVAITLLDGEFSLRFVTGGFLLHSFYSFLRLLLAASPYFALTLLAGVWGGSSTAGIAVGTGVLFLESIVSALMTLAGGWVQEVPKFLLDRNVDTLALQAGGGLRALVEAGPFGEVVAFPDPVRAGLVLAAWAVALSVLAFVWFGRQDLGYRA